MHKRAGFKLLLSYSVPAAISMMVAAFCNISDRWFIGESEGITALAGLSLTLPLMVLLTAIGSIVGTGGAILIGRCLRRKEIPIAEKILGNTFSLTFLISLLIIFILSGFQKEIILLFGGRTETLPYAVRYLNIIIPGSIFLNLTAGLTNCMRVCGFARKAAWIVFLGIVLNVVWDYYFISVLGMGIEGGAIATVLSMGTCALLICFHFLSPASPVVLRKTYFKPQARQTLKIILTGMTPFFMNLTICTVSIIMNNYLVVHGGTIAIGAYGIISSYTILIMITISGICQGMQILIHNHSGIAKVRLFRLAVYAGAGISCTGFILGEFFTGHFISPFTSHPELTRITQTGLRIVFCTLPILGFQLIVASFFQSIDKTRKALFINMSRQFIFLIPSLFVFSGLWGIKGIWIAVPFSDLLSTFITTLFIKREKTHFSTVEALQNS